jgi:hypothetical protein
MIHMRDTLQRIIFQDPRTREREIVRMRDDCNEPQGYGPTKYDL